MKLPVIATVVEAYRLFFANLAVYARLIWFPAIVLFTASVYARNYLPTAYEESADALPILIGTLLEIVAWTVVTVPAMTAWSRLVVLGRDNADTRLSFSIRAAEWRYLYREILLLLAVVMLGIALFIAALLAGCALFPHCNMDELAEMAAPFMNAFLVLVLLCFARLTLVFPAVAVGRVATFGDSWRLAKGNGFRLALLMLIVLLPTYC